MRITVLSDTHTRHGLIPMEDLPGGDLILHAGDIMNSGFNYTEISDFCTWFGSLNQYTDKVFIAGNHDRVFENHPEEIQEILNKFLNIDYLQDEQLTLYEMVQMEMHLKIILEFMAHLGNHGSMTGHSTYQEMELNYQVNGKQFLTIQIS
jgi:predicted phosphodiesterase